MTNDLDHYVRLRDIKKRRLHELEYSEALQGLATPPEIAIEIDGLRKELQRLESIILAPEELGLIEELGSAGRYQARTSELRDIRKQLQDQIAGVYDFVADAKRQAKILVLLLIVWLTVITIGVYMRLP